MVWDHMFGPVAYFDPSGTLLRHRSIDLGAVFAATQVANQRAGETVYQPLPDGSFVIRLHHSDWQLPDEGKVYREPVGYVRIDSSYNSLSFGWWEGQEFLNLRLPIVPFPARSLVVGGGTPFAVYITNGDRYEVHQFPVIGQYPQRIFRRPTEKIAIEPEMIRKFVAANRHLDADWEAYGQAPAATPQRFYPPIREMRLDSQGYLWTLGWSVYEGREGNAVPRWSVFHEGRWLGDVSVPTTVVRWIGDDLIIGSRYDRDTGLETLAGYRLNRFTAP